jgi:phosphoribosylamine-glycine ligase
MSFLIISEDGAGHGLALRLQQEGHAVSITIGDSHTEMIAAGLVEKSTNPDLQPTMISDSSGYGMTLDAYRDKGGLTFSGSQKADRLENDRQYASSIFEKYEIQEPASESFESWEEAEEFVQEADDDARLVFKPAGEFSGNLPSYVSKSKEDLLEAFARFKKIVGDKEPQFVLQEFIEGTCISSEGWFAKDEFCRPFNHTLERKQLMNGDIGPSGGCTGNVVWRCEEEDCPLCENLWKIEHYLNEVQWCGPIDINTVVDKEGEIYALEFTPRFGYDAFPTLLYGLFEGDFGSFVSDCCRGEAGDMPLRDGFAAGIRVSIPPWPSKGSHAESGLVIPGLSKRNLDRFYAYEIGLVGDEIVTSGGGGCIGIAVAHALDMEEAFVEAQKFCKKLDLPDAQYRTDLAEMFSKDMSAMRRAMVET